MGNDPDILQEIVKAEEEGRRRVEEARGRAAARLVDARREVEEYRQALLDGIRGRAASLTASLEEEYLRESAAGERAAEALLAEVDRAREGFGLEAIRYLREELLGGR